MTERKLASVRKIAGLQPIAGADKIELAIIDGWQVVVKKGEFKVDDLCVYFEIDSFLPCIPVFEFLRKGCFKSTKHLGDGYRLRTIKLKKTLSQGLALPLADLFVSPDDKGELAAEMRKNVFDTYQLGADLTEILGIKKYEIEIPASLAGTIKSNFPSWLKRTDQERIQNCFNDVPKDHCYEVTLKLDGSSLTVYKKDGAVSVCSRNLELVREPDNAYWKVVIESGLEQRLLEIPIDNIALQGELMGPGVQGNREQFKELRFYLFDIWDITNHVHLDTEVRSNLFDQYLDGIIYHVPVIDYIVFGDKFTSVEEVLKYAEKDSINACVAEGVVFKSMEDTSISFKAISNHYLLQEQ